MIFRRKKEEETPIDLVGAAIDSLNDENIQIKLTAIEYLKQFDEDRIALAAINLYPEEIAPKVKKGLLRLFLKSSMYSFAVP